MLRWIATAVGGAVEVGLGLARAADNLDPLPDLEGAIAWIGLSCLGAGAVLAGSRWARAVRPAVTALHGVVALGIFGSVALICALERAQGATSWSPECAMRTGFLVALVGLAASSLDAPCLSLASRRSPS